MSRFFLNVRMGDEVIDDPEGIERPSVEAAKAEAVEGARSILCDELCTGRLLLDGQIDVVEEGGSVVAVVPFEEVVSIER